MWCSPSEPLKKKRRNEKKKFLFNYIRSALNWTQSKCCDNSWEYSLKNILSANQTAFIFLSLSLPVILTLVLIGCCDFFNLIAFALLNLLTASFALQPYGRARGTTSSWFCVYSSYTQVPQNSKLVSGTVKTACSVMISVSGRAFLRSRVSTRPWVRRGLHGQGVGSHCIISARPQANLF